jgi:beta-fructofuranosidase
MEVPQVFRHGKKWYCLFCTSSFQWSEAYRKFNPQSPITGTHYLMADSHLGPWQVAPGSFFDGALPCKRYSGKVFEFNGGLHTMAFLDQADGKFVGQVCDPIPVSVDAGGLLHVKG